MTKPKTNYEIDPLLIKKIIETIDRHLIDKKKAFVSMTFAYELLLENNVFKSTDKVNLKYILENGLIPHAKQTDTKRRQWRNPLSETGKKKLLGSKSREVKKQINNLPNNLFPYNQPANFQNSWYSGLNEREKRGFKRLVLIVVITVLIVLVNIWPDNRPELIKQLESNDVGQEMTDYTYDHFNTQYGHGRPLYYSDFMWVYYYPKGDFTICISKKSNRILEIKQGMEY